MTIDDRHICCVDDDHTCERNANRNHVEKVSRSKHSRIRDHTSIKSLQFAMGYFGLSNFMDLNDIPAPPRHVDRLCPRTVAPSRKVYIPDTDAVVVIVLSNSRSIAHSRTSSSCDVLCISRCLRQSSLLIVMAAVIRLLLSAVIHQTFLRHMTASRVPDIHQQSPIDSHLCRYVMSYRAIHLYHRGFSFSSRTSTESKMYEQPRYKYTPSEHRYSSDI